MKIIAVQSDVPGVSREQFTPYIDDEIRSVWTLLQADVLREIYFRQDKPVAVIILECASVEEANTHLGTLPLVRQGLIAFDVMPLVPYGGFARLFANP